MKKKALFLLAALCFAACDDSDTFIYIHWGGSLAFDRQECDIVERDPPQINPNIESLDVQLGSSEGDPVRVLDGYGNRYSGTMTSGSSFRVTPTSYADASTAASIITFSNIWNGRADVEEVFVRNAPHGCSYYFTGIFYFNN